MKNLTATIIGALTAAYLAKPKPLKNLKKKTTYDQNT